MSLTKKEEETLKEWTRGCECASPAIWVIRFLSSAQNGIQQNNFENAEKQIEIALPYLDEVVVNCKIPIKDIQQQLNTALSEIKRRDKHASGSIGMAMSMTSSSLDACTKLAERPELKTRWQEELEQEVEEAKNRIDRRKKWEAAKWKAREREEQYQREKSFKERQKSKGG